jgi:Zn-finger protein
VPLLGLPCHRPLAQAQSILPRIVRSETGVAGIADQPRLDEHICFCYCHPLFNFGDSKMAKKAKKRKYKVWTREDVKELKRHSREKTPVSRIAKEMKRTEATIRMKAYQLGFSVGHRRRAA